MRGTKSEATPSLFSQMAQPSWGGAGDAKTNQLISPLTGKKLLSMTFLYRFFNFIPFSPFFWNKTPTDLCNSPICKILCNLWCTSMIHYSLYSYGFFWLLASNYVMRKKFNIGKTHFLINSGVIFTLVKLSTQLFLSGDLLGILLNDLPEELSRSYFEK